MFLLVVWTLRLDKRVAKIYTSFMKCTLCPRNCNIDRNATSGFCGVGDVTVSRIACHDWEEPCISGTKGSGTIFFAGCNLRCRFCQNYDITVSPHGVQITVEQLADAMLYLQDKGMANINLVTASHFVPQLAEALKKAKPMLHIPVVYNTSSYEKVEALKLLDGLVDVYLPDLKFCSSQLSAQLAYAPDYFQVATDAIKEMRRQQPQDQFDREGYITKGVIVRHLVLPTQVEDSKRILDWICTLGKDTYVSLMSQYFPARQDGKVLYLNRRLFKHEYSNVTAYFENVGLHNGFTQQLESATRDYLPEFSDSDVSFVLQNMNKVFS